jgi:ribonuclease PH
MRVDGRRFDQLRSVTIEPEYVIYPEGSALITMGKTRVLCNATVEEGVPRWMKNQNIPGGWVTAEYALLPRSTQQRTRRETQGLRGRTQEIRRLIGRSLRAAVQLNLLGERTFIIDCDVLQADGGTRTASITGGFVALAMAIRKMNVKQLIPERALKPAVAAVSVGMIDDQPLLDLCYQEDSRADVDVNIVMNAKGKYIEIQSTAEGKLFTREGLNQMLDLASAGIGELLILQKNILQQISSS